MSEAKPLKKVMINTFIDALYMHQVEPSNLDYFRGFLEVIDDNRNFEITQYTIITKSITILDMMIKEYRFDPGHDQRQCLAFLYLAIENNDYDMVEYLLKYVKDINMIYQVSDNHTNILEAALNIKSNLVSSDIIDLLKMHGALPFEKR